MADGLTLTISIVLLVFTLRLLFKSQPPASPSTASTRTSALNQNSTVNKKSTSAQIPNKYITKELAEEPLKVWSKEAGERQIGLRKRKEFMMQQARIDFAAKQKASE